MKPLNHEHTYSLRVERGKVQIPDSQMSHTPTSPSLCPPSSMLPVPQDFPWDECRRVYSYSGSFSLRFLSGYSEQDGEFLLVNAFTDAKTIMKEWLDWEHSSFVMGHNNEMKRPITTDVLFLRGLAIRASTNGSPFFSLLAAAFHALFSTMGCADLYESFLFAQDADQDDVMEGVSTNALAGLLEASYSTLRKQLIAEGVLRDERDMRFISKKRPLTKAWNVLQSLQEQGSPKKRAGRKKKPIDPTNGTNTTNTTDTAGTEAEEVPSNLARVETWPRHLAAPASPFYPFLLPGLALDIHAPSAPVLEIRPERSDRTGKPLPNRVPVVPLVQAVIEPEAPDDDGPMPGPIPGPGQQADAVEVEGDGGDGNASTTVEGAVSRRQKKNRKRFKIFIKPATTTATRLHIDDLGNPSPSSSSSSVDDGYYISLKGVDVLSNYRYRVQLNTFKSQKRKFSRNSNDLYEALWIFEVSLLISDAPLYLEYLQKIGNYTSLCKLPSYFAFFTSSFEYFLELGMHVAWFHSSGHGTFNEDFASQAVANFDQMKTRMPRDTPHERTAHSLPPLSNPYAGTVYEEVHRIFSNGQSLAEIGKTCLQVFAGVPPLHPKLRLVMDKEIPADDDDKIVVDGKLVSRKPSTRQQQLLRPPVKLLPPLLPKQRPVPQRPPLPPKPAAKTKSKEDFTLAMLEEMEESESMDTDDRGEDGMEMMIPLHVRQKR